MTAAAHIQLAVLIHHRVVTRDFSSGRTLTVYGGIATVVGRRIITRNAGSGAAIKDRAVTVVVDDGFVTVYLGARGILAVNGGVAVIVHGGFVAVNLRAGAAVADGIVTVVVHDRLVAVYLNANRIRIRDGHTAFVVHRCAVAGDINTVTAAAHIQLAVLIHHRVVTRDFSSGGAFAVDDGFSSVVYCGIVARNNELTVVIILPLRCTICAHPFKGNRVIRFINLPKINSRLTPIAILQRNSPVSILGITEN